jgi:hypothetical protein
LTACRKLPKWPFFERNSNFFNYSSILPLASNLKILYNHIRSSYQIA